MENSNITPKSVRNLRKNFFRDQLLSLINKTNKRPIVLRARFQWTGFIKQWCFRDPAPFLGKDVETWRICQHLNIRSVDTNCNFYPEDDGQWFYLIGFPSSYRHYGLTKGCLKLVRWNGLPSIFSEEELLHNPVWYEDLRKTFQLESYRKISAPTP